MFDGAADFFIKWIIKFANKLPSTNIDTQELTDTIHHVMGKINYFIPFYMVAPIFNVWMIGIFASIGIVLFIKFFGKFLVP